ncbi:hypothetical protein CMUST_10645 [Corynebacterium mustelae]|uniref:Uncharacterized protein n=1 Tax=Corynebacterium mustelae TaxID=571915 RepID=A0A0G3H107_9CORY|nr:hypothetical protein [Corynebacterium mustelae]AKK06445.1 hypothetical protein CMUST_10645 [Corynebacterium mustelae]
MDQQEIARILTILDDIEDGIVETDYELFIQKTFRFIEAEIVPLAKDAKSAESLAHLVEYGERFLSGELSAADLQSAWDVSPAKRIARSDDLREKAIAIVTSFCVSADFLTNVTPDDQQDSHVSYLVHWLYGINQNTTLCEKFYSLFV